MRRILSIAEHGQDGIEDDQRLGHPPGTGLAAGHVAGIGANEADAVGLEPRDIPPGRRMAPHHRVHGRRHQDGLVGGEQCGRGEVVGMTVRHLRHEVGGGRCDDHEIGLPRQPDVAHLGLVGEREELVVDLLLGKARDRQGRDELGPGAGQDGAKGQPALAAPADQLEHLVGGDAAADDQKNTPLLLHAAPLRAVSRRIPETTGKMAFFCAATSPFRPAPIR